MRKKSKKLDLKTQQIKVLADTSLVVVQGGTCPSHAKRCGTEGEA